MNTTRHSDRIAREIANQFPNQDYSDASVRARKMNTYTISRRQFTRFGVKWSIDGKQWLAIVTDKTIDEATAHFNANTAKFKKIVRHDITETEV